MKDRLYNCFWVKPSGELIFFCGIWGSDIKLFLHIEEIAKKNGFKAYLKLNKRVTKREGKMKDIKALSVELNSHTDRLIYLEKLLQICGDDIIAGNNETAIKRIVCELFDIISIDQLPDLCELPNYLRLKLKEI